MLSEESVVKELSAFEDISEKSAGEKGELRVFERGEKICAVIEKNTNPLRIELRCDFKLSKLLQERYESVMESRSLGKNGIEIICSGQLSTEELHDLIRHAYEVSA
jgi:predicted DNA-binding protein (MmcQ/YjbR family)